MYGSQALPPGVLQPLGAGGYDTHAYPGLAGPAVGGLGGQYGGLTASNTAAWARGMGAQHVLSQLSQQDPGLAWVQQQHLVQKAHVSQEIIALQREGLLRQRDVAVAQAAVHQAQRVLQHAQALQRAVSDRVSALNKQMTALDLAQRRAAD